MEALMALYPKTGNAYIVGITGPPGSTLLISVPGSGDEIQALKAWIMEIGNIYVVNKSDLDGANRLVSDLRFMHDLSPAVSSWSPPIVKTVAVENEGIDDLIERILDHRKYLENGTGLNLKRKDRVKEEIVNLIKHEISKYINKMLEDNLVFEDVVEQITSREKDPYSFARKVTYTLIQHLQGL